MKLEKNYFHSVHSYKYNMFDKRDRIIELEDILKKYELIFKSGYILPYSKINKLYGNEVNRNNGLLLNGNNMVSISLHKNNPEQKDIDMYKEYSGNVENSFQSFILQEPSIVLNERIKEELKFYKYPGIYLERLVEEPISLKYMEALSIFAPGYLEPFFYENSLLDYEKNAQQNDSHIWYIQYVDRLLDLLNKYDYQVPLVDIVTGNKFKDNGEYRKVLSKIKNYSCIKN